MTEGTKASLKIRKSNLKIIKNALSLCYQQMHASSLLRHFFATILIICVWLSMIYYEFKAF